MDHFGAGCVEQLYGGGGCKNRIGVYFISETGLVQKNDQGCRQK